MFKKTSGRRLAVVTFSLFCLLALGSTIYIAEREPVTAQPGQATFSFVRYTGIKPFKLNWLPTTKYGPAWADVVEQSSNMLTCKSAAPIALCYYSGPDGPTPCNLDGLGIANCTCYEIPAGNPLPYMVDINAILKHGHVPKNGCEMREAG